MSITKLGQGPFNTVEVMSPDHVNYGAPAWSRAKLVGSDERCGCCNAKITWRVVLEAPAQDGAIYIVGLTCAKRAEEGVDLRKLTAMEKRVRYQVKAREEKARETARVEKAKDLAARTKVLDYSRMITEGFARRDNNADLLARLEAMENAYGSTYPVDTLVAAGEALWAEIAKTLPAEVLEKIQGVLAQAAAK